MKWETKVDRLLYLPTDKATLGYVRRTFPSMSSDANLRVIGIGEAAVPTRKHSNTGHYGKIVDISDTGHPRGHLFVMRTGVQDHLTAVIPYRVLEMSELIALVTELEK